MSVSVLAIKIHNLVVRFLTSFILVKDVRKRLRELLLAAPPPILAEAEPEDVPIPEPPCKIGANTYIGSPVRIFTKETQIGSFCSISWDVNIGTTHHPTNWLTTHIFPYSKRPDLYKILLDDDKILKFDYVYPVTIGNDVWIGCDVTILDGVKIGDGAIIGAGAIVTKDIPPYAIAAGAPAKVIRYRFDEQTIKELLELKWWDLDEEIIKTLPFDNIQECIKQLKQIRGYNTNVKVNKDSSQ